MALYSDQTRTLEFGYNAGVPENVDAAWGARLILERGGNVDMLPDRQGFFGDKATVQKICDQLNSNKKQWRDNVKSLYNEYQVRSDEPNEVVVYENDVVKMVGNTNGSYGYFYVAAWLK